jgi:hypothetical protein
MPMHHARLAQWPDGSHSTFEPERYVALHRHRARQGRQVSRGMGTLRHVPADEGNRRFARNGRLIADRRFIVSNSRLKMVLQRIRLGPKNDRETAVIGTAGLTYEVMWSRAETALPRRRCICRSRRERPQLLSEGLIVPGPHRLDPAVVESGNEVARVDDGRPASHAAAGYVVAPSPS